MDRVQYILGRIAEEASEVAQAALKAQAFGLSSCNPNTGEENLSNLLAEFRDTYAAVSMLCGEISEPLHLHYTDVQIKKDKINHYAQFAEKEGMVEWSKDNG